MVRLVMFPIKLMLAFLLFSFLVQSGLLVKGVQYAWITAVAIAPIMLLVDIYIKWSRGYRVASFGVFMWTVMTGFFIAKYWHHATPYLF